MLLSFQKRKILHSNFEFQKIFGLQKCISLFTQEKTPLEFEELNLINLAQKKRGHKKVQKSFLQDCESFIDEECQQLMKFSTTSYEDALKNYKKAYELSEQEDYKKSANAMQQKINPGKKKGFFSKLFG